MPSRDSFSAAVKHALANRSGNHCSNPRCRNLTAGPDLTGSGSINLGEAAHITAASRGGCRYDSTLTPTQRASQENGIWLCVKCATLIDKHCKDYSVQRLRDWKTHSEYAARNGLEHPHLFASGQLNAYTLATVLRYTTPLKYFKLRDTKLPPGMQFRQKLTFKSLGGYVERAPDFSKLMMLLDANFGKSPNATAFVLQLENVGTGTEPHSAISLKIKGAPFWQQTFHGSGRMHATTRPSKRCLSGLAGFSIADLLPGECAASIVFSNRSGPFDAEWFCTSKSQAATPMIFDVLVGEPEVAQALPPDPIFDKEQYPFD